MNRIADLLRCLCVVLLLCAAAQTARADWVEASSDHFLVVGNQDAEKVRDFSERLELYQAAMSHVFGRQVAKPSPSNRVTIFVVSSERAVRELAKTDDRYLAGIYLPRAGGSIAIVPKLEKVNRNALFDMSSETILLHEYAHHFMMTTLATRTYPRWLCEGFAEFFASAAFRPDSVALGMTANHRAYELANARSIPIRQLLEFDGGASLKKKGYSSFYGQSWALFHYLQFEPARAGQLVKYERLLAKGDTALAAAEGAFGDLDTLERDLASYLSRRTISYMSIARSALSTGAIDVRPLRPGEAAMMPTRIRSMVGVNMEEAVALVPEARRIAAQFPDDAMVMEALAEAEVDAGNHDAAIAAADRALALDATRVRAQIQKAYAFRQKARKGGHADATWQAVRSQFVKANRIENDHPVPLVHYYETFLDEGISPTPMAIQGLEWAMQLAPFDGSVRWMAVQQMVNDGRLPEAAATLAPLAYSAHPGENTEAAQKLLREVEARLAAGTSAGR